eukprot:TRINITY_DN10379_c0_g1_i1.p1 TRINITY_DN10379_c0_g1~~TRINITY_DN10379_c0_g1_i1.p1  ORF type:complete len:533 (+),score=199.37 TRINITY_DN10379_c0_g1_i1:65-1600(+)
MLRFVTKMPFVKTNVFSMRGALNGERVANQTNVGQPSRRLSFLKDIPSLRSKDSTPIFTFRVPREFHFPDNLGNLEPKSLEYKFLWGFLGIFGVGALTMGYQLRTTYDTAALKKMANNIMRSTQLNNKDVEEFYKLLVDIDTTVSAKSLISFLGLRKFDESLVESLFLAGKLSFLHLDSPVIFQTVLRLLSTVCEDPTQRERLYDILRKFYESNKKRYNFKEMLNVPFSANLVEIIDTSAFLFGNLCDDAEPAKFFLKHRIVFNYCSLIATEMKNPGSVSIKTVKAATYFLSKATQHDFVCKEILKSETLLQFFDVYSHTSITFNDNFLATSYHCGKVLKNLKAYCEKNEIEVPATIASSKGPSIPQSLFCTVKPMIQVAGISAIYGFSRAFFSARRMPTNFSLRWGAKGAAFSMAGSSLLYFLREQQLAKVPINDTTATRFADLGVYGAVAFFIGRFFPYSFVPSLLGSLLTKNYNEFDTTADDLNSLVNNISQGDDQGEPQGNEEGEQQ